MLGCKVILRKALSYTKEASTLMHMVLEIAVCAFVLNLSNLNLFSEGGFTKILQLMTEEVFLWSLAETLMVEEQGEASHAWV